MNEVGSVVSRPGVLLVDDVAANLVALRAWLEDLDCDLVLAGSGNEALRQLLKREFAVMLLDVQMPGMDGYEVARYARDNPATRDVPIIFLTAANQTEDGLLRGYGSGAVDVLFKPVSPVILRSKVSVFLDLSVGRARLADRIVAHQKTLGELETANGALRRSTEEASAARQRAEQANNYKSRFIANISHELRTPLNAVIGFSEMLQEVLQGQQQEFAGHIYQSGKHLLGIIEDLLDLSTIEAGRINLRREWIPLQTLVRATGRIIDASAQKRRVSLTLDVPEEFPPIFVDPKRFKQILSNLLSNAVKFTPDGGSVRLVAAVEGGLVSIAVEDTGVGIHENDLPRLFHEFERIENDAGLKAEGTGLGLALTKRLVELHGGRTRVTSQPGKGSVFTVELPLDPGVAEGADTGAAAR